MIWLGGLPGPHPVPANVELDVLYTMKGSKYKFEDPVAFPGFTFEETDRLGYISIPLMARYALLRQDAFHVYIMAGPELSFLTSAKWTDESTGEETDCKDELKSTESSIDFGAGVGFPVSTFEIRGDVRYGLGLSTIHNEGTESVTNNVFYINLAIVFPINTN